MTLLALANYCGTTMQEIARLVKEQFHDNLLINTTVHVPDRYVSAIVSKFPKPKQNVKSNKKEKPQPKKQTAQFFGEREGKFTPLYTLAKDINTPIQTIVADFPDIFDGNKNPNSRVSQDIAEKIMIHYGKDYLIAKPKESYGPKKEKSNKKKSVDKNKSLTSRIISTKNRGGGNLSGKVLLRFLKEAIGTKILSGKIVSYNRDMGLYFVDVMGFKSLLYENEALDNETLEIDDVIEVMPVKVDGKNKVEYMTVSMKRANDYKDRYRVPIDKKQRELEFSQLEVGSIIESTISRIEDSFIIVEFGNLHGIIYKKDLFWGRVTKIKDHLGLGQPLTAKVLSKNRTSDGKLNIALSYRECCDNIWNDLTFDEDEIVPCSVVQITEDGAILKIAVGIEGFIHKRDMTHAEYKYLQSWDSSREDEEFCIKSYDAATKTIRLYSTPFRDEEWWNEVRETFIPHSVQTGFVFDTDEYGIWVGFENMVEAYIHKSELYWKGVWSNCIHKVGDDISVVITDIDDRNKRISASVRLLTPDPWVIVDNDIVGKSIEVTVRKNILGKCLIVETNDNLHLSGKISYAELSWLFSANELPDNLVPQIDEVIEAKVVILNKETRTLALSVRQLTQNPWADIEPGAKVKGIVGNCTSGGYEVVLQNGLKAISQEKGLTPNSSKFIDFKVLTSNRQVQKIEVSHRQYLFDQKNESIISSFFTM